MKKIILIALIILTSSCTSVKRFKHIEKSVPDTNNLVSVDLFGTKVEGAKDDDKSKSLWDLEAEGEAELIEQLSTRNPDNDKFNAALNSTYLKNKAKPLIDYTSKDVKMVFSISKKRDYNSAGNETSLFSTADRIEYLKFSITIPSNTNLEFVKWNKFTTEYGSIDIADMTFSESLEVTAGTGVSNSFTREKAGANSKTINANGVTPSISAKGAISDTEAQKVKYRYVSLNGIMSNKAISMEQEGIREIDLTGNVTADVQLKFAENPETLTLIEGYKTTAGAYNTPDKLKAAIYQVTVPAITGLPATIPAILDYEYAYRHVSDGEKTFYEWDDTIRYLTAKGQKNITLFTKKDYLPEFYNITVIGQDNLPVSQRTRIMLEDTIAGNIYELIFPTLTAAQEFWSWLQYYTVPTSQLNDPIILASPYKLIIRQGGNDSNLTKQAIINIRSQLQPLLYYR